MKLRVVIRNKEKTIVNVYEFTVNKIKSGKFDSNAQFVFDKAVDFALCGYEIIMERVE